MATFSLDAWDQCHIHVTGLTARQEERSEILQWHFAVCFVVGLQSTLHLDSIKITSAGPPEGVGSVSAGGASVSSGAAAPSVPPAG